MEISASRVLLVRNARSTAEGYGWPAPDAALSVEGRAEAEKLADDLALQVSGSCRVVTSPFERARQTILPYALRAKVPVTEDAGFRSIDVGGIWGIAEDEAKAKLSEVWEEMMSYPDPDRRYFLGEGETVREEAARVWDSLLKNLQKSGDQETLVVSTHLSCIAGILCTVAEMPLRNLWIWRLSTASVTILENNGGRWRVERVGCVGE